MPMPARANHSIGGRRTIATLSQAIAIGVLIPGLVSGQTKSPRRLETADIAAIATPATATIIALDAKGDTLGQGSGFIVRNDGVVVTNFHVLRGATGAVVVLASKERFARVRVLDADSTLDLALLKIPGADMPALEARTTIPRVGERVVAIGSPLGLTQTVSDGIVSASRVVDGRELVQITAPISPGSSGGAVLDASGRVFAVSTLFIKTGQALNFAVPVRYALGMLNDPPPERTMAAVFGGLTATPGGPGARNENTTTSSTDAAIARHPHPRPSVAGTYSLVQHWYDVQKTRVLEQMGLLFATEHVGFLVLANKLPNNERGPTKIYRVSRWATNEGGDVILSAGQVTFDGFQTADDGFVASGMTRTVTDSVFRLVIGAVPVRLPLSRNDGLFVATARSTYEKGGFRSADPVDWTGETAIAFARDSIYVSIYLTNAKGGTTAFNAVGPLIEHERFDLVDRTGSTLTGSVRDGRMIASFVDKRDNGGALVGTLQADRK